VSLVQLIKFLVVELIYSDSSQLIILLVGDDIPVDSEAFLVTDFTNLKIKPTQSFRNVHSGSMRIYVFKEVDSYTCINICVWTAFFLNITLRITSGLGQ
jgi:hypothetical protein